MRKWLIKKLCPKADTLAGLSADGIAKYVNDSKAETKEKIARLGTLAANATEITNRLARMVDDGTIEDMEKEVLKEMLTPVFEGALSYAFSW